MTEKDGDRVTLLAWAKAWSKNSHLVDAELSLVEIAARMKSKEPMKGCTYCLRSSGPMIAHRQINRQGCKVWLEEDNRTEFARRNAHPRTRRTTRNEGWLRRFSNGVTLSEALRKPSSVAILRGSSSAHKARASIGYALP